LSRAILSITKPESEYIVYSNDLINARNIARDLKYPTHSKWMHVSKYSVCDNFQYTITTHCVKVERTNILTSRHPCIRIIGIA
jgi:hypothetical protein